MDSDAARSAIREIDSVGPEAIPVLLEALSSEERRPRYYAVFFLSKLGPEGEEALPALRAALDDESDRFRESVERAIASIEGRELENDDE